MRFSVRGERASSFQPLSLLHTVQLQGKGALSRPNANSFSLIGGIQRSGRRCSSRGDKKYACSVPSMSSIPERVLPLLPPLAAAVHHITVTSHLPAVHSSLPAQCIGSLTPPLAVVLTSLLSPFASILTLILYIALSTSALPAIQLALLWLSVGVLPAQPFPRLAPPVLVICFLFVLSRLPSAYIPSLQDHAPPIFFALSLLQYAARSHAISEFRLRFLRPSKFRKSLKAPRKKPAPPPLRPHTPAALFLQSICFVVCAYTLAQWILAPAGAALVRRVHPRALPSGHAVLAQARGPTGLISVVHLHNHRRMLTADLSVLGGRHARRGYAEDSIFSQFYVHEAVRLTRKKGEGEEGGGGREGKALCIGLGVGIVADALHRLGSDVDAVELDPYVAEYARRFFGMTAPRVYVQDALEFLREGGRGGVYDYVVHDVFTGGAVPGELFSMGTWRDVRAVMKADGVVVVNFVGDMDVDGLGWGGKAVGLVYDRLEKVFGHVRVFSDGHEARVHNFVYFASAVAERVTFRKAVERDLLGSGMREATLGDFEKFEVKRRELGETVGYAGENDWVLQLGQWWTCRDHMKLMKELHSKELWPALLRMEIMG